MPNRTFHGNKKMWKTRLFNYRPIFHLLTLNTYISKSINAMSLIFSRLMPNSNRHNVMLKSFVFQVWSSRFLPLLRCLGQLCEILLTVGSSIGQADFSPPLSKHLYLQKYNCYVIHLITANFKQSGLNTIQK